MNEIPSSLNFANIFHGMIGKDFITAFNENFNLCDRTFLAILADMIYKVKSTDIKEFRINNGLVEYTNQDESVADRVWTPIDISTWGHIKGDINDQADLIEALNAKAAQTSLDTLSALVNSINLSVSGLGSNLETANRDINNNANNIAKLVQDLDKKISSTTIKEMRLTENVLEWSPDGINWYRQDVMNTLSWGSITGDITQQSDLYQRLTSLDTSVASLTNTVSSHTTAIAELKSSLEAITPKIESSTAEVAEMKETVEEMSGKVSDLETNKADSVAFTSHVNNHENPHEVTKEQIGLGNVDNTADADKPVSNPQQAYIQEAIDGALTGIGSTVANKSNAYGLAIINSDMYASTSLDDLSGTLVLISDDIDFDLQYTRAEINAIGSISIANAELEVSNTLEDSKIKFTVKNNSTESAKIIDKVISVITNYDGTTLKEEFKLNTTLAPSESTSFYSELGSEYSDSIVKSNLEIFYKNSLIEE